MKAAVATATDHLMQKARIQSRIQSRVFSGSVASGEVGTKE